MKALGAKKISPAPTAANPKKFRREKDDDCINDSLWVCKKNRIAKAGFPEGRQLKADRLFP